MPEGLWLAGAVAANAVGLAWLALAMEVHWHQVAGPGALGRSAALRLRVLGGLALLLALGLCLAADHASMASLVWVMSLAAAAPAVAFTLSYRPRLLSPLAALAGASGPGAR